MATLRDTRPAASDTTPDWALVSSAADAISPDDADSCTDAAATADADSDTRLSRPRRDSWAADSEPAICPSSSVLVTPVSTVRSPSASAVRLAWTCRTVRRMLRTTATAMPRPMTRPMTRATTIVVRAVAASARACCARESASVASA